MSVLQRTDSPTDRRLQVQLVMRQRVAAVLLAVTVAVTGCVEVVGTVTSKEHEAGERERYSCTKTVNGKSKSDTCYRWDDEDWEITVTDAEGRTHEVVVTRSEFDRLQLGDTYDNRRD